MHSLLCPCRLTIDDSFHPTAPLPVGRSEHCVVAFNSTLAFVAGGRLFQEDGQPALLGTRTAVSFDLETQTYRGEQTEILSIKSKLCTEPSA